MSVVERVRGVADVTVSARSVATGGVLGSRVVLAVLAAAFVLAGEMSSVVVLETQGWLYLALMIGIGLPHGGYEHVANLRGRGDTFQVRYLLAYVGLLAAALGLFVAAPAYGLGLAVFVTAAKGGYGDVQVLRAYADASHLASLPQRILAVVVRGGAVLGLALAFHPGDFTMIAAKMVAAFGGTLAPVGWLFSPGVRTAVAWGWPALAAVHVGWGLLRVGPTRGWRIDAGETVILGLYFAAVPPILAVGVYFACWYAARQVARMGAGAGARTSVAPAAAVERFLRAAALPWLGAVAVFASVALAVVTRPASVFDWVALYSVAIAAIALPHVVVGSWLDREQGIWSVST